MREIIFAGQVKNNYLYTNFAKSNKKDKEPKRNLIKGAAYLGASGIVGQQAIRSGIPRLLGVRLESHSTSKKNAKEILKNGGILDPNKGGSGATKNLTNDVKRGYGWAADVFNKQEKGKEFLTRAKNSIYITGRNDASANASNNVANNLRGFWKTPVGQSIYKKGQRAFYRGQSSTDIDRDAIESEVKNWRKSKETQEKLTKLKNQLKDQVESSKKPKSKLDNPRDFTPKKSKKYGYLSPIDKSIRKGIQEQIKEINSGARKRAELTDIAVEKRKPEAIKKGLLGRGKSLYIGGGDDYFNKNFVPDPDDAIALKTNKPIKVSGSRTGATLEALKREGGGSRLKGIARLVKANPSRALAGAGILAGGGLLTAKLGQAAYRNITAPSDGKVKGFSRKNKSGKWSNVKSFIRDKIKK